MFSVWTLCKSGHLSPFLDENLLKEDYMGPGPLLAWYMQDGFGSVRQLVSDSGRAFNSYAYTAWGVPLQWHERVLNRYTYTSREYNPETGLYHYRARNYVSMNGHFNTRDVLGGINPYVYAKNNPIILTNPLGLWDEEGHEEATEKACKQVSSKWGEHTLDLLKTANTTVDSSPFTYTLHMHAMRGVKEDWKTARTKMLNYLKQVFALAVDYAVICATGIPPHKGLIHSCGCISIALIGTILHTVQDIWAHYVPDWRWTLDRCVREATVGAWRQFLKYPPIDAWILERLPGYPMTMHQHGFACERTLVAAGRTFWEKLANWVYMWRCIDLAANRQADFRDAIRYSEKILRSFIEKLKGRGLTEQEIECCVFKVVDIYKKKFGDVDVNELFIKWHRNRLVKGK